MRRQPEAAIRRAIRELLKQLGFAVWDCEQNRATRQTPGLSDLIAMGHGRILFIECKTPKGRLSDAQHFFGAEVERNNGVYLIWRSTTDAWDWLVERGIVEEAS